MKFEDLINKENILFIIKEIIKNKLYITGMYSYSLMEKVVDIKCIEMVCNGHNSAVYFTMITKHFDPGFTVEEKNQWINLIRKDDFENIIGIIINNQRKEKLKRILN